jgi:hypothetical protein
MAFRKVSNFDAPIPGQSLTHEVGARPWQQPAQFPTVEESLEYYIPRLSSQKFMKRLFDILERGIPITALSETITLGGVMQGLHTIDVAVLINPILVEFIEGIAKQAGVEYTLGDTDDDEDFDGFAFAGAMEELKSTPMMEDDEPEEMAMPEPPADLPKTGLMARRGEA